MAGLEVSREALRRDFPGQGLPARARPWPAQVFWPAVALVVLLRSLLCVVPVAAQEPAGRFVSVQGPTDVVRGPEVLPATVQLSLQPGDLIRTGPNARAAILLADGTQLKLAANSTLQLKQVSPAGRVGSRPWPWPAPGPSSSSS